MKSTIFNFGDEFSLRENFFLTKVLQKYRVYQSRGEDQPFAYIPYSDKETILGKNPNQKVQKLLNKNIVKEIIVGENSYKNKIKGYIPLKTQYTIMKVDDKQIDLYYLKKKTNYQNFIAAFLKHYLKLR